MSVDEQQNKSATKAAALAAYNEIVESAELQDIRLVDLKFSVKPEYYALLRDEADGKKELERSFETTLSQINYDAEARTAGGQFNWSVFVIKSRKKMLKLEAQLFVLYTDVPDVGHEHINAYIAKVGRFATYPYFRSLVSQLSWEAHAELPLMPVLK